MLRIISTFLIILISYLLQTSVLGMMSFLQTAPNLFLIIVITIGTLRGKEEGLLWGAFCGLFLDLFSGGFIGFFGIIYMYIGFSCGFLFQHIDADIPLVPIILVSIGEIIYHFYIFVFRFLLRGRLSVGIYLKNIVLPELVITVVFAVFIYGILMFFNRILEDYEKRSALKFV